MRDLLAATLDEDNTRRTHAEAELTGLTQNHGFCAALLEIARSAVRLDLRKSAAVYLKNQSEARKAVSTDDHTSAASCPLASGRASSPSSLGPQRMRTRPCNASSRTRSPTSRRKPLRSADTVGGTELAGASSDAYVHLSWLVPPNASRSSAGMMVIPDADGFLAPPYRAKLHKAVPRDVAHPKVRVQPVRAFLRHNDVSASRRARTSTRVSVTACMVGRYCHRRRFLLASPHMLAGFYKRSRDGAGECRIRTTRRRRSARWLVVAAVDVPSSGAVAAVVVVVAAAAATVAARVGQPLRHQCLRFPMQRVDHCGCPHGCCGRTKGVHTMWSVFGRCVP